MTCTCDSRTYVCPECMTTIEAEVAVKVYEEGYGVHLLTGVEACLLERAS